MYDDQGVPRLRRVGLSAASPRHISQRTRLQLRAFRFYPSRKGSNSLYRQQCINATNQMLRYLSMTRSEKVHDKIKEV